MIMCILLLTVEFWQRSERIRNVLVRWSSGIACARKQSGEIFQSCECFFPAQTKWVICLCLILVEINCA